jgi:penicillin amidase
MTGRRWLRRVLLAVTVPPLLLLAAAGAAIWWTLPSGRETPRIPGLTAPVDIAFDTDGVPRIHAGSERDAAVALGWVHARDRLFQMDMMRRAVTGRLSELAGPATVPFDRQMRVLGLGRLAEGDLAAQTPDARALLEAYAAGVNAWIEAHGRFSAPEFLILGQPAPWRPADSLMWGRMMGLWLSSNYRAELARQAMRGKVPDPILAELWPSPPPMSPSWALGPDAGSFSPDRAARLLAALPTFPAPFTMPASASNEWAVDGRWTSTGAPLLAGDPHLNFAFPGLWYLVRVETPGHVLAGATAPGVPFLVLGRNERIGWSFTTTSADTQDLFVEPPDTAFTTREERIAVRGQPDTVITVRESPHGPVISDLSPDGGPPLALAAMNLRPGDTAASGLLALNRAGTLKEAGAAAALITSPVQNMMVADRAGIGLFTTGRVPIRRGGDGWAPVPGGKDDRFGWTGFASGDALPHIVAPANGRLVNTNEPVAGPDFPVFMGRDVFRDWRAQRLRARLDQGHRFSAADFEAMQKDIISPSAAAVLPVLRTVPGVPDGFRDWDGAMAEDDARPLIFAAWMETFRRAVLERAGLTAILRQGAMAPSFDFIPHVLSPAGAHWCGGSCDPLLKQTLDRTMSMLSDRFGPNPAAWRWGEPHRVTFAHPFLRGIPGLSAWATARIPVPGDGATVDRGGYDEGLEAVHGASYRGVYDLAVLDRSLFVIAPGQSGNIFSHHAWNFLPRWHDNRMISIGAAPVSVAASARLSP